MKHVLSSRFTFTGIAIMLFTLVMSTHSFAAVDAYIIFKDTKSGQSYQAKVDATTGACIIKGVPAGTYTATLSASPDYFSGHSQGSTSGTIEIQSFSWGVSNSGIGSQSSGSGAGKVSMSSFTIMKRTDKASPNLAKSASPTTGGFTNQNCPIVTRKAGRDQGECYDVVLGKVTISGGGDEMPSESRAASAGYDVKTSVKL